MKVKPKARIDSIGIRTHDRCDPGAVLSFALILALASEPTNILVPRAHDPSGLWQGSRVLALQDFLSIRRVFVSNSQPIRFARYDGKSVNRGLPVSDQTRALDPNHRPEGSWALGTRMVTILKFIIT